MRNTVLGMALLAAPVLGGAAHAAERGPWYIGAGAGRSLFSSPPSTYDSFASIQARGRLGMLDLRSSGVRAYGGFRVNRYFALEAGYADFGKITFVKEVKEFSFCPPSTTCITLAQELEGTTGEITSHGWNLGMRGFLPLGERLELNGRLGVSRSTTTLRAIRKLVSRPFFESAPISSEFTARRTSPLTGVGMSYRIAPELSFTLDWERIGKIGSAETTGEMSVKLLSAGFRFDF